MSLAEYAVQTTYGDDAAKTIFSELLDRAAAGEEITITRGGSPVAKLVPARRASTLGERIEAIKKMEEIAGRNRLDGLKIKDLINEGRR